MNEDQRIFLFLFKHAQQRRTGKWSLHYYFYWGSAHLFWFFYKRLCTQMYTWRTRCCFFFVRKQELACKSRPSEEVTALVPNLLLRLAALSLVYKSISTHQGVGNATLISLCTVWSQKSFSVLASYASEALWIFFWCQYLFPGRKPEGSWGGICNTQQ